MPSAYTMLNFRTTKEFNSRLSIAAKQDGVTMSEFARRAIEARIADVIIPKQRRGRPSKAPRT